MDFFLLLLYRIPSTKGINMDVLPNTLFKKGNLEFSQYVNLVIEVSNKGDFERLTFSNKINITNRIT